MRRSGTRFTWTAAALLLSAACGTTTGQTGQAASGLTATGSGLGSNPGSSAQLSSTADGAVAAADAGAGSPGTQAAAGQRTPLSASGPNAGPAAGSNAAGGAPVAVAGSAPGVTATTINVGILYQPSAGADNSAVLGTNKLDPGDQKGYWDAVIRYVNSHGGISGRKVVPVYYRDDGSGTFQQQEQAACSYWTQDHHVFAVLSLAQAADGIIATCTQKAGAVDLNSEQTAAVPATYARFPNYVDISAINLVRVGKVTVDGLFAQGYFKGGWDAALAQPGPGDAKIGVLAYDLPNYHEAVTKGVEAAARAHGLEITDARYVSGTDAGAAATDTQNAILKFQSEGINRVLIVDGSAEGMAGILTIYFATGAQSAHYYPRLGLNTVNDLITAEQGGFWTDQQLQGANAVNWFSTQACVQSSFSACTSNPDPAFKLCQKIMNDAGVSVTNPNASLFALTACDTLWFLQAGIAEVDGPLSARAFIAAVNRLRSTFDSPFLLRSSFSASRHDGVGGVQYMSYSSACGCFKNTSGVIPV